MGFGGCPPPVRSWYAPPNGWHGMPSPDETTVIDVAVVHCTSDARTRIGTAAGHLHGRVRMAAADAAACGKRDRLDRHMAAAAPVRAPAGTRFPPLVFEVHGGCTGDTAREIRHLLNAWSEQNGYDETRCAVNRHAWPVQAANGRA